MWKRLTGDSQIRWLGPEKGVIHLATAALVNAIWDLYAKREDKPLWQLVADMSAEEFVNCIDFRYLTDVITPDEAPGSVDHTNPVGLNGKRGCESTVTRPTRARLGGSATQMRRYGDSAVKGWRWDGQPSR